MRQKIAVFPIPTLVAFPGMTIPLYVFEPRYRQLITDSLREGFEIGLCPPKSLISMAQDRLSGNLNEKNLNIYSPHEILGCGCLKTCKSLSNGDFKIAIHITRKVEIVKIINTTPYILAETKEKKEIIQDENKAEFVYNELLELLSVSPDKTKDFEKFQKKKLSCLIFDILSTVALDFAVKQCILEEGIIEDKADMLIKHLRQKI